MAAAAAQKVLRKIARTLTTESKMKTMQSANEHNM
jgi:hypothetical protein